MKKLIKIVYPVSTVAFGGVETFIRHTALFHDVSKVKPIYCFLRNGPLVELLQSETNHDIRVYSFPIRLRNPISVLKSIFWLKKQIQSSDADLVHSSMAYTTLFGSIAAFLANVPHIWFQHGPVSGWMDQLAGILPSKAIIYNSQFTLGRQLSLMKNFAFLQKLFSPKLKNFVLYLGGTSLSREHIQKNNLPHIGMLCRFQKWKGIDLFIEAIIIAQNKIGKETFKATIWGDAIEGQENAEYGNKIIQLCKAAGIQHQPHTRQPDEAIQQLDIVVNSSIIPEPFGLTIVEAMNVGVIPIAPSWGGPLEIIEDGVSGLFFEPKNANDLAGKLIDLIQNKEKRTLLSKNAKVQGLEKFSANQCIRNLESFYFSLML